MTLLNGVEKFCEDSHGYDEASLYREIIWAVELITLSPRAPT